MVLKNMMLKVRFVPSFDTLALFISSSGGDAPGMGEGDACEAVTIDPPRARDGPDQEGRSDEKVSLPG